jgi:hypothetical protein
MKKSILEVIYELFINLVGDGDDVSEEVINLLAELRAMIDELESGINTDNNNESN